MQRREFFRAAAAGASLIAMPGIVLAAKKSQPRFVLKGVDVNGKAINLDDYKGKSCLVSFFTTECIPCTNDLRLMREFYGDNQARNYVNLGVNMDAQKESLVEYIELLKKTIPAKRHFPIAWRNAKGHTDNFGKLTSEPTHFVLNKDHKLVMRRNGIFKPDDWDDLWTNLE